MCSAGIHYRSNLPKILASDVFILHSTKTENHDMILLGGSFFETAEVLEQTVCICFCRLHPNSAAIRVHQCRSISTKYNRKNS